MRRQSTQYYCVINYREKKIEINGQEYALSNSGGAYFKLFEQELYFLTEDDVILITDSMGVDEAEEVLVLLKKYVQ